MHNTLAHRFLATFIAALISIFAVSTICPLNAFADEYDEVDVVEVIIDNTNYTGDVEPDGDLFANFNKVLPGNEFYGMLKIINKSDVGTDVNFTYTDESHYNKDEAKDFLDKVEITITKSGGEEIYSGPLAINNEPEKIFLGAYYPGDEATLMYHLVVPEELTNEYALSEVDIKWVFDISQVADDYLSKMGDLFPLASISVVFIALLIMIIVIIVRRKQEDEEEITNELHYDRDLDEDL